MSNLRGAISNMTADLRQELSIAWQQVVEQGNLYPMIEFYNRHETRLQNDYGLSLNELMGFDPNDLNVTSNGQPIRPIIETKDSADNPLSGLIFDQPRRTENTFSIVAISAFALGAFLIIKSFKK